MARRLLIVRVRTQGASPPSVESLLLRIMGRPPGAYLASPVERDAWWYLQAGPDARARLRRLRSLAGLEIGIERARARG